MRQRRNGQRRRGRPAGRTEQGDATRRQLYETALGLIAEKGYDESTLRDIARAAAVSPGLLYRYFPNKRDVVLTLHDELSAEYARRVRRSTKRAWAERLIFALKTSIQVLRPHRDTLAALIPVLVSNGRDGVLSPERALSRRLVEDAFIVAVTHADDAPDANVAEALGRIAYLVHLAVLLWWLLDRSPKQEATTGLLKLCEASKAWLPMAIALPGAHQLIVDVDQLIRRGLWAK
jgi:AcrR family transcriptional regulator